MFFNGEIDVFGKFSETLIWPLGIIQIGEFCVRKDFMIFILVHTPSPRLCVRIPDFMQQSAASSKLIFFPSCNARLPVVWRFVINANSIPRTNSSGVSPRCSLDRHDQLPSLVPRGGLSTRSRKADRRRICRDLLKITLVTRDPQWAWLGRSYFADNDASCFYLILYFQLHSLLLIIIKAFATYDYPTFVYISTFPQGLCCRIKTMEHDHQRLVYSYFSISTIFNEKSSLTCNFWIFLLNVSVITESRE